jgi:hypothetical protein
MNRRWANVPIYEHSLHFAFQGGRDRAITSDWPDDAQVIGGHWDQVTGLMVLTVHSESFDEVAIGNVIPEWSPTFTAWAVEPGALAVMELIDKMKDEEIRDVRARA